MAAVVPLGTLRTSIAAGVEANRSGASAKCGTELRVASRLRCHDSLRMSVPAVCKNAEARKLRVAAVLDIVLRVADRATPAREAFREMCAEICNNREFRNVSVMAVNALLAMPALAEEEKGKIFDFNLTLPIMAVQFLLLMVALDTIWFKPVAKVMDERDAGIREQLMGVRDNSGEIKKLTDEAAAIIKAARAETTLALNKTKRETAAELEAKIAESRARIEKELAQALTNLTEQKEETLRGLEKQVTALSDEILEKVIPFKI